ncbi:MAG: hypothetical protein LQ351_005451 [Letrouitia transgressa]|nr:MAG: hypothetical protein LQ351_005451 [Letrouitia transgressa]
MSLPQYGDRFESPGRRIVAIQDLLNPVAPETEHPQHTGHLLPSQNRRFSSDRLSHSGMSSSSRSPSPRDRINHRRLQRRSRNSRERREFRPTYSEEEINFIWYHRVDLGYDWNHVLLAFDAQFPNGQRRDVGGIQCKYYRHLENYGVPQVRQRDRNASAPELYGMRVLTGLWYPWMR